MNAVAKVKLLPFELEITSGPHLGQKFSFAEKEFITIGRGTENLVCLQHDPRISRVHVEIKQENEIFYIYNKTEKNHILVNGHKESQYKITQSCSITIGESEVKFILPTVQKQIKNPLQALSSNPLPVAQQRTVPMPYPAAQYQQMPSAPMPANASGQQKRRPVKKQQKFNPLFLIVIAAVIIVLIFVIPNKPATEPNMDKPPDIVTPIFKDEQRLKEAMDRANAALLKIENQNSRQAMAQQFFISGMREFLNGNYQRAINFLNSAYQSDPTLVDAEKFSREAQRKLDRLIDFYYSEGIKYRESNNYRMCKSSFQTVQLYIRSNLKHPRYVEAKQFFDECSNLDKVRRF